MNKQKACKKTKRKTLFLAVACLLLIAAAAAFLLRPAPADLAERLLARTLENDEYSFTARAVLICDGVETPYFELQGEVRGDSSAVHGTVLGEPAELSYEAGVLTQLLPDGRTVSHALSDLAELGQLYAELLPASAFEHQGVVECVRRRGRFGPEYVLTPASCGGWVGGFFRDPRYIIGCGPLGLKACYLMLEATEKVNGRATLRLEVSFDK